MISGAKIICKALKEEGVEVVFGYPGGAALNIYDEIYKQNDFKHILVRHEQSAAHAADAYSRASSKVGVALVTSGPGFTNTLTGLATAYCDSIPMVLISAQVATSLIGTDAFQEIDAIGMSRPCVKHSYLVKDIKDLAKTIKEAFYIAKSGRPGPVHIDIPKDITALKYEFNYPSEVNLKTYKPTYKGHLKQIKKLAQAINESKKPLLYIGGGAMNASNEIKEFIKKAKIPSVCTLMALGILPDDEKLNLKMAGMHGSYKANMAISECDLLISIGARFDDRITGKTSEFAKMAKIAHIDIDPCSISKIIKADYPIVGDASLVISDLTKEVNECEFNEWYEILNRYENLYPLSYEDSKEVLKPQWVISRTAALAPKNSNIITDVGQHQMWVAQFYPFYEPRRLSTSGGLGTMGYSIPAALGVAFAKEDELVINFVGDGSFLMNVQELMTLIAQRKKVINIILNNSYLGMVRQWQTRFYEQRYSSTDLEDVQPDFVALAKSFGCDAYRVSTKTEFDEAFKKCLDSKNTCVLDVIVNRFEDVLPMVPAGAALYNMILPSNLITKEDK
ncbi:acetolactate synthase large subunit [Campylobacter canadensis]|uniref:Acetolactate synthase n=1 Tax=Campylobacter canadensis TaxID=449520 RepID=A0ABS7WPQ0_9BACT|nr:acetolactate synthase large subunit [Campylobacter canadensis]MBZ7986744.1 acetolactate synthase large subunit [Campylobacter canadensis]MBZ7994567.1 acetolactate synthase large subunit [Campylobacter canadensis]MBZ7997076.1 acetolactate synthase large subunit [Campylobacter canadensis]MBZ7997781.1 acetolactate synthase large subunit [Campylobacter canadensis]MBZ7999898.1 acetolactate synthase large subunit [Campylobacter canadensis]